MIFVSTAKGIWGAEHSLLTLLSQLKLAGAPVHLWASAPDLLAAATRDGPLPTVRLSQRTRRLAKNLSLLLPLARTPRGSTIVTWDVDLVIALAVLRPVFRLRNVTTALDLHLFLTGRLTPRLTRFLVRWIDDCVAISNYVANQVRPRVATHIVQRPVAVSRSLPPSPPSSELRVGVVGRVDREKRVELAIRALAEMRTPAVLTVRGAAFVDGSDYLVELQALALHLSVQCRFEDPLPQARSMERLDVLLHCNSAEPAGRVVQEAQLAGVVALVPDRGGSPEFVADDVTGLVYRSDDPDDAAQHLDRLHDPTLRSRLCVAAREHARVTYDPRAQALRYLGAVAQPRELAHH